VFAPFTAKEHSGNQLWLQPGQPMLFAGGAKGIALDREALALKVVEVEGGDWQSAGVLVHDPRNRSVAHMLVEMPSGAFPTALGVLYEDPAPTFESAVVRQNAEAAAGKKADLQALVSKGQSWMVTKEPHAI
jgi:2-oxoglutarate ferredoxin oxidoreductase subunit beta